MILPKGASYKFIWTTDGKALLSTKTTSLDSLLKHLASNGFSGYLRITVEREDMLENGYLLMSYGKAVGAEFLGKKKLLSEAGLKGIRSAWKLEGILDLFEFNEVQTQLSIEENEEALFLPLKKVLKEMEKAKLKTEKTPEKIEIPKQTEISKTTVEDKKVTQGPKPSQETFNLQASMEGNLKVANSLKDDSEEILKDRMAILEKFGLKDPGEEFGDEIVKGLRLPSDRELNQVARELKLGLIKELKKKLPFRVKELDLYVTPTKTSDAVEFALDIYLKPIKKGTEEKVESVINKTMKERLDFPIKTLIKIMPPN
jgi:hypothetical protein